jgi:hypothetical protein
VFGPFSSIFLFVSIGFCLVISHATLSEFQTPLWAAIDKGHASAVAALIDLGADVGSFNRYRAFFNFELLVLFIILCPFLNVSR